MSNYQNAQTFSNEDYGKTVFGKKTYEQCKFVSCNFVETDLSSTEFIGCTFDSCNMALIKLANAGLKTVVFSNCKLIGVDFNQCADFLFNVRFNRCLLDYSSFMRKKMRKTLFNECSMIETNFSDCDLSEAVFDMCNMSGTIFSKTNLGKANFYTSQHYSIDPTNNIVKKAVFSVNGVIGLLHKFDIVIE